MNTPSVVHQFPRKAGAHYELASERIANLNRAPRLAAPLAPFRSMEFDGVVIEWKARKSDDFTPPTPAAPAMRMAA